MHPMFPALVELEVARRQDELRHDRVTAPRPVGKSAARRVPRGATRRLRRPTLRLVRG